MIEINENEEEKTIYTSISCSHFSLQDSLDVRLR